MSKNNETTSGAEIIGQVISGLFWCVVIAGCFGAFDNNKVTYIERKRKNTMKQYNGVLVDISNIRHATVKDDTVTIAQLFGEDLKIKCRSEVHAKMIVNDIAFDIKIAS